MNNETVKSSVMDDALESITNCAKRDPNRWQQKKFYNGGWRAVNWDGDEERYTKCIRANIEAGINLIQNACLIKPEMLLASDICEREGVEFMVFDLGVKTNDFRGSVEGGFTGEEEMSEDEVQAVVDEFKHYKHLMGYYVWDEVPRDSDGLMITRFPGEFRNLFEVAGKQLKMFEKADPNRLAYSLALPGYNGAYKWHEPEGTTPEESNFYKYISDYVEQVDPPILGVDYYPLPDENAILVENDFWRDLGLFRGFSNKTGKPLWLVYQGQDMKDGTPGHMTRAKFSAQMFGGIAYGSKALVYFSGPGLITDEFGNKSSAFDVMKQLNSEVQNVGELLLDQFSTELYHFGISDELKKRYFDDDLSQSKIIEDAPAGTIVSVLGDHSTKSRYVMVVNKEFETAIDGKLVFKRGFAVEEYDKINDTFSDLGDAVSSIELKIPAGDCVIYKLK